MEKIREILRKMHPQTDFDGDGLITRGVLDSLDIAALVGELNVAFSIRIPARELLPENFDSVEAIYQTILRVDSDA